MKLQAPSQSRVKTAEKRKEEPLFEKSLEFRDEISQFYHAVVGTAQLRGLPDQQNKKPAPCGFFILSFRASANGLGLRQQQGLRSERQGAGGDDAIPPPKIFKCCAEQKAMFTIRHAAFSSSELFLALGEPTRLQILMCLMQKEMTGSELRKKLKIEKTLLSKHLSVLEVHGMVTREKSGRINTFRICPDVRSKSRSSLKLHCCNIDLKGLKPAKM